MLSQKVESLHGMTKVVKQFIHNLSTPVRYHYINSNKSYLWHNVHGDVVNISITILNGLGIGLRITENCSCYQLKQHNQWKPNHVTSLKQNSININYMPVTSYYNITYE